MKKPTEKQIKEIFKTELSQDNVKMYFHCKACLPKKHEYFPAGESPQSFMSYEVSSYGFTYPSGVMANILVVWCKKCGKSIWDSRHLQPWI